MAMKSRYCVNVIPEAKRSGVITRCVRSMSILLVERLVGPAGPLSTEVYLWTGPGGQAIGSASTCSSSGHGPKPTSASGIGRRPRPRFTPGWLLPHRWIDGYAASADGDERRVSHVSEALHLQKASAEVGWGA